MNALRKDLLERRLWPVIVVLLAGIVAVPLLLLKHASANGASLQPPSNITLPGRVPAGVAVVAPPVTIPAGALHNPFTIRVPRFTAKPASQLVSLIKPSSPAARTTATMVTPSPAATGSQAAATTSTTPTPATTPPLSTPPVSTTPSTTTTTPVTRAPSTQSWTVYAVDLRSGKDTTSPIRSDLPRLSPLPAANLPELMFMGVTAGGQQAVFALAAGVRHNGPGWCRPSRWLCSTILLSPGQTERITVPRANGGHWGLIVRVVQVRRSVTHSRSVALLAYERRSAAGQCLLNLTAPLSYSYARGTLSTAADAACLASLQHSPPR